MKPTSGPRWIHAAQIAVVAASYYGAARLGLSLADPNEPQVTLVWPPTGIALASVLLFGPRVLPGVALGAFFANLQLGEPVLVALGIAAGNTAEAFVALRLLRLASFEGALPRIRDVVAFILLGALASTAVAATLGVATLCAGGLHPWASFGPLWRTWWFGDAMGALLFAPVILAWADAPRFELRPRVVVEASLLVAGAVIAATLAYGEAPHAVPRSHPLEYLAFPFLAWAALRFRQRGAASVTCVVAVASIVGTVRGYGPFVAGSPHEALALLELFLGVFATTGLFLGAAMSERDRARDRLLADHRVGQALAGAASLADAAPKILSAVCETLHWDCGALWVVDRGAKALRCVETSGCDGKQFPEFEATTRARTFEPGVGLPGRVWKSGEPAWIPDVAAADDIQRAAVASKESLHAAFACPVALSGEVVAVMEFFSARIRRPDPEILAMMAALGRQVGQFMEREDVGRALRDSETRFRFLAEAIPSFVWTADADGSMRYVNRRWFEYSGVDPDAVTADTFDDSVHPDDRGRRRALRTAAFETGRDYETEVRVRAKDGSYRWFLSRAVPWRDPQGRVVAWFGVTTDIHERKEMETRLLSADKRKDEFLATLAHELRNPLAPLSNALELLSMGGDESEQADALALARRQLSNLIRLVDDLMDVSRITRGKVTLRPERTELAFVVERGVETSRPLLVECGQELVLDLPKEPVWLDVDPTRIAQVVANLLNNAAKYSDGGRKVRLSAAVERDAAGRAWAVVRVRDEGIGIAPELLPGVFEPFMQAAPALERSHGGLGIGLSLVKRLVEMHGGTVEATSAGKDKGSEFVVRLPLPGDARPAATESGDGAAAGPAPRRRVLVADDNRDSAQTMTLLLAKMGADVRTAYDGDEALTLAGQARPDVVLLDIGMPKMDGYEVARRIRAAPWGADIKLIALTGWGQDEDRRRSKEAGFDHHLVKPVNPKVLRDVLASVGVG
jgi:PAS domain S-box-containing protein